MEPKHRANTSTGPAGPDGFSFDAFLSYSRKDSPTVRDLAHQLEERNVAAWFDERQIDVGDPITEKIQEGLESSRYLIVCLSRHFKDSEWCRREYSTHLTQEIKNRMVRVLPVRIDDYTDEDVPEFLFDKYAVDVRTQEGLSRLVRKVKTHLQIQSFGPARISSMAVHTIEAQPHAAEESDADLEAAVQLWLPHAIARSFFEMTQKTDDVERLRAIAWCVDHILSFLTLLCLADYTAQHRADDLHPLLTGLDGKALGERIELLSKLLSVTAGDRAHETFIPHLLDWAFEPEGDPSAHFLTLFKLALTISAKTTGAEAARRRSEELLEQLLASLLWLRLYRPITIGDVQYPRPTLARGHFKSLVGVVKGFLPEAFLWELNPGEQLEPGCYLINPERTGLLRLDPFLLTRDQLSRRAVPSEGGDLWAFSGLEKTGLIFRDSSGIRLDLPLSHGDLLFGECSLREQARRIDIQPMDERLVPGLEEAKDGPDHPSEELAGEAALPEEDADSADLEAHLSRLQKALLSLGAGARSSDRMLVDLDGIGVDLLESIELFPEQPEGFQEVAIEWSRQVDQFLETSREPEAHLVLNSRRREVEDTLEDLLGGFSRSQSLFMNGTRFRGDSPFSAFSSDRWDLEHGLKLLLSNDDLEQSDGIDWLLHRSSPEIAEILRQSAPSGRRDPVLSVLWRHFPRVFLYYREPFWDLAKFMLDADSARWRPRLDVLRDALEREISSEEAKEMLAGLSEEDRRVIAAFLAMHPRHGCREIGMSSLKPADRWEILLAPSVHTTVIHELVEVICKDSSPSYIKAMFLLLRSRLRTASTPLTLSHSFEILKIFYGVPLFLEAAFFRALLSLHKDLSIQAQKSPEMAEVGRRFEVYLDEFRKKISVRDTPVTDIHFIPLPIQRKLARDGYFVEVFICNARDSIALESVPHALRRADVIRFFKSNLVNKLALQRLAEDKHVMQEYAVRTALCHNPKADPKQIRKILPQIGVSDLTSIAEDKNASQFARSFAKQILMLKTS